MNYTSPLFSSNELLSKLPSAELTLLHPLLTSVRLVNGQILYEAGERIEQVFFVQQGFISMVAEADGNNPGTEVGLVGCEGMVGSSATARMAGPRHERMAGRTGRKPGVSPAVDPSDRRRGLHLPRLLAAACAGTLGSSIAKMRTECPDDASPANR